MRETRRQAGWTLVAEPPHGYRRVVASPEPVAIVEEPAIRTLLDAGVIVIALGGGGVPVVRARRPIWKESRPSIDKDLASALLAIRLRVDVLAWSTDVDRIYVNFAPPDARGLGEVTADEAAPARRRRATSRRERWGRRSRPRCGSSAAGGGEVIVTSPDRLAAALEGHEAGTHVVSAARVAPRGTGLGEHVAQHGP